MMEIIFPMQILFVINFFIWIIYIILKYLKHKEIRFKDEIFKGLFIIYITFLIGITMFPICIRINNPDLFSIPLYRRANLDIIPFVEYFKNKIPITGIIKNVLGNIILLMPLNVFAFMYNRKFMNIKSSFLLSLLTSISIELMQLVLNLSLLSSNFRAVSIEDVILNTIGGLISYFIYSFIYDLKK